MNEFILPIITIALSGLITIGGAVFNYNLTQRSKRLDEQRQRQAEAERLAARYAKPLLQAAYELEGRLEAILDEKRNGRLWLWPNWQPDPTNAELPPLTFDYYLKSSLYLIGQFFAWIDIMKKEEIFLPLSDKAINQEFQTLLDNCIKAFSDSRVASGVAIFRQQQRAIGEQMSEESAKDRTLHCASYSTFVDKYEQDERFRRWFEPAESLILQIEREGDPRMKRLQAITLQLKHFKHFINTKMGIQIAEQRLPTSAMEAQASS
ncbi:MAG TPA: hypothetical protein VH599_10335 [Ktedonobacterales bacterium]|jgi:hypothetical protein